MFGKILNSSLWLIRTCGKSSISDVWQGFEFAFAAINDFRKKIHQRDLSGDSEYASAIYTTIYTMHQTFAN